MTATMPRQSGLRPAAIRGVDDSILELVAMMGTAFAPRAADHDRDNTVVAENVRALQASGSARLTVHADLDGLGDTLRQICHIQAELARWCASTAPTAATHRFITLVTVYPQRRMADIELILTSIDRTDSSGRWELPRQRPPDPL